MAQGMASVEWPVGFDLETAAVSEDEALQVAEHHAAAVWGGPVALGPPLQEFDTDGTPCVYAVPVAIGSDAFPDVARLLDWIAAWHREHDLRVEGGHWASPEMMDALDSEFGRFGTVYVSADRAFGPVLMTTNTLPPFLFMADLAVETIAREGQASGAIDGRLGRLIFANPHEEYIECAVGERLLMLDSDSLQFLSSDDLGTGDRQDHEATSDGDVEAAWSATLETPEDLAAEGVGTVVTVPCPQRIPPVNWTYWCAPTAWTMAFSYWDTYTPGHGTHLGYGKVVDFWFDHDPTMNNVPNLIDEIIDKTKTPPTWRGDTFKMINAQGYSFSKSAITCTAANGWGFTEIKAEIDAGRPLVVGMMSRPGPDHNNHAMVAYGYRISPSGQRFLKLMSTWGSTWSQQDIEVAVGLWEKLPLIKMGADRLIPGGGPGANHVVLGRPAGGSLTRLFPYDIEWWVWGTAIQRSTLMDSVDGGRTWRVIETDLPTKAGKNTYRWVPQDESARTRVRVAAYTSSNELVAADGSRANIAVTSDPLNQWTGWLGLGRPGSDVLTMSVDRNADGRLELVALAVGGTAWHRYQAAPGSSSWIGWGSMGTPPGGIWLRDIRLTSNADGRLEVIALGSDGALWHRWQPAPSKGPWAAWTSMGKPGSADVRRFATERNKDGRIQVFAIGDDERVWTAAQSNAGSAGWSAWSDLGSPGPTVKVLHLDAAANTDGRIEIVISGGIPTGSEFGLKDPRVWLAYQPQPNQTAPWSTWIDFGHPLGQGGLPAPHITRNADGRLEIFDSGLGGQMWHRWQPAAGTGPWSAWSSLGKSGPGESLMSPLAVLRSGDGRLQAFTLAMRSTSDGLRIDPRHVWQVSPNNGWGKWAALGSPSSRTVEWLWATQRHDGRIEAFALSSEDKCLWHNTQT